jgi:hypothetical protein
MVALLILLVERVPHSIGVKGARNGLIQKELRNSRGAGEANKRLKRKMLVGKMRVTERREDPTRRRAQRPIRWGSGVEQGVD